jgi:flavin reductase (DIM6/NTAB) family NADH-FMN oxidoreductase RutF
MAVDSAQFRHVLGHFATGVTVVTAATEDELAGFTANAFSSVSLDPPLVLVCIGVNNVSLHAITASNAFCINILSDIQEDLARCFATTGPEKRERFCAAEHSPGVTGSPIITGALGWIDCRLYATYPAGDHLILVGEVQALAVGSGNPLLYYGSRYRVLGRARPPSSPR